MADGINFKILDPLAQLVASGSGGGSGSFLPLAGGTMSGQITQPLQPSSSTDLVNKSYADSKVSTANSIPGASIVNNSVTDTQLAAGAAAANINNGPAGSINATQIAGGPFLPLTGGTISGNIILTSPAKIQQAYAPLDASDLTNKTYVDNKTKMAFIKYTKTSNQVLQTNLSKLTWETLNTPTDNATTPFANIVLAVTNDDFTINSTSPVEIAFKVIFNIDGVENNDPNLNIYAYFYVVDGGTATSIDNSITVASYISSAGNPLLNFNIPGHIEIIFVLPPLGSKTIYINGQTSIGTANTNTTTLAPYIIIEQIY